MKTNRSSIKRSIIKSLSWRICGTVLTGSVAMYATSDIQLAFTISASDFLIKLVAYYWHERLWENINELG